MRNRLRFAGVWHTVSAPFWGWILYDQKGKYLCPIGHRKFPVFWKIERKCRFPVKNGKWVCLLAKQENGLAPTTQCCNVQICVVGQSRFLISSKTTDLYYMERHLKISEKAKVFSKFFSCRLAPLRSARSAILQIFSDYYLKNRRRNDGKHIIWNRFGKEKGPRRGAPGPNPVLLNNLPFWTDCFALCHSSI